MLFIAPQPKFQIKSQQSPRKSLVNRFSGHTIYSTSINAYQGIK